MPYVSMLILVYTLLMQQMYAVLVTNSMLHLRFVAHAAPFKAGCPQKFTCLGPF